MADEEADEKDIRKVISTYFQQKGFVHQQLESCNEFYSHRIQQIIDDMKELHVKSDKKKYRICFGKVSIGKPNVTEPDGQTTSLYPKTARLRNLSYSSSLYVKIKVTTLSKDDEVIEERDFENVYIGKVPTMINSICCRLHGKEEIFCDLGECPGDTGGYFIVNGVERVLVAQERIINNCIVVSEIKAQNKYTYVAEIRCNAECRPPSTLSVQMIAGGDPCRKYICATLPYIRTKIPIAIIFRGLDVLTDRDILKYIGIDKDDSEMTELIKPSLEEALEIRGMQVALEYIGKRGLKGVLPKAERIEYAYDILYRKMLPHMIHETTIDLRYNFGYIIHRLLMCALGRRKEDDKYQYAHRRIDLSGPLLGGLFRQLFGKLAREARFHMQKSVDGGEDINLNFAIKAETITKGFKYAFTSGNWDGKRCGVSQVLNRLTYAATLSHLRRLNSSFGYEGKQTKPRQVHSSQWGRICPCETPEGQACGLVKNLSLMSYITVGSSASDMSEILKEQDVKTLEEVTACVMSGGYKIFLNGCLVGVHSDANQLVSMLKQFRRLGDISTEVGIIKDIYNREVRISTDHGRCTRPLLIVENVKLLMKKEDIRELEKEEDLGKWDNLITKGFLEYIDADEEETAMICMTIKQLRSERDNPDMAHLVSYTHCELHPSLILGTSASMIPFPQHNQSSRNRIQSAINKQAIGIYASNFQSRMDRLSHVLYYPQKPLVKTWMTEQLHSTQPPAGINVIVAVACYSGYNQEDSIIMNQSSIDRGLFRSLLFRTYRDEERRMGTLLKEHFGRPNRADTMGMRRCKYEYLDSDGFAPPGTQVFENDVIIGKTDSMGEDDVSQTTYRKHYRSTYFQHKERGIVDRVMVTTNADGLPLVKAKVRSVRIPEVGDKFSSRHGQKGVVGLTMCQENLPWTIKGIIPDIIINPHAIPSRMTVGQLMESIISKVAALKGEEADATPFTDVTVDSITHALHEHGYERYGNEAMVNGETGRMLDAKVCIGPTYYLKLAHMVEDKIHSRARGRVQILTRQPTEGRSRGGGIRFGEMERDCAISYGAANLLKERLCLLSDPYSVYICERCGLIAQNRSWCKTCSARFGTYEVHVPYPWKLLCQELMSMSIAPRMRLEH